MCLSSRLQAQVQPIARSLLRIDLSIVPDFRWAEKFHGTTETFVIIVEDADGEIILFHDSFVLRQWYAEDEHNMTLTIPMFEPIPLETADPSPIAEWWDALRIACDYNMHVTTLAGHVTTWSRCPCTLLHLPISKKRNVLVAMKL
jgi:hypothetical protein